jgi:hypothetical protein
MKTKIIILTTFLAFFVSVFIFSFLFVSESTNAQACPAPKTLYWLPDLTTWPVGNVPILSGTKSYLTTSPITVKNLGSLLMVDINGVEIMPDAFNGVVKSNILYATSVVADAVFANELCINTTTNCITAWSGVGGAGAGGGGISGSGMARRIPVFTGTTTIIASTLAYYEGLRSFVVSPLDPASSSDIILANGVVYAETFSGNISASNVTSGMFNSGNYYFPANVGIGTTSPSGLLHIADPSRGDFVFGGSNIDFSFNGGPDNLFYLNHIGAATGGTAIAYQNTPLFWVRNSGNVDIPNGNLSVLNNVGIGTYATTSYKLYVNGTAFSTGGWARPSDARLKNILSNIQNPIEKLMNLNSVIFTWKRDEFPNKGFSDGTHFGLIAQEVEKVFPEIIREDGEGYKTIYYDELIPVLVEAIKELKKENVEQQSQIQTLKQIVCRDHPNTEICSQ